MPTLRQLELFLSLVQSEAISSAGAKLGMSPSATSHALKALEDALGVAVIDRGAPGTPLTFAGEQILPHVRDVFASLHLVQAVARSGAELKTGMLQIGSFGASGSLRALPPVMERFKARYPGVDVHVSEKPDEQTTQDLVERRIELAAVTLPKPELDTLVLATDELVAVLPAGHPLTECDVVPLKEFSRYPFIMTRAGSQPLITKLFARHAVRPKIVHEMLQLMSNLELVARGEGVSILARLAVPERYPGIEFRAIKPSSTRQIGLACVNENRLSPAAKAFWLEAKRYGASLRASGK